MIQWYKTLGIPHNASLAQVKEAYHKMVRTHHPDKGGKGAEFIKIQDAYQRLVEALESGRQPANPDLTKANPKSGDLVLNLPLTLNQLFTGQDLHLEVDLDRICPDCRGKAVGRDDEEKEKNKCQRCHSIRVVKQRCPIHLQVPAGCSGGDKIQLTNQGHQSPDKQPGHVVFVIKEQKHPFYQRQGAHLVCQQKIPLVDALSGYRFLLTDLTGQQLLVQTRSVITPGQSRSIPGLGMPIKGRTAGRGKQGVARGQLVIKFQVDFPKAICQGNRTANLSQLLQQPSKSFNGPVTPEMKLYQI